MPQMQCAMSKRHVLSSDFILGTSLQSVQFWRRLQSGSDRHRAHRLHPGDVGRRARQLQPGVDREHGRGVRLDGAECQQPRRELHVRRLRQPDGLDRRHGVPVLRLGPLPHLDGHLCIRQGESVAAETVTSALVLQLFTLYRRVNSS